MSDGTRIGTTGKIIRRCACRGALIGTESVTESVAEVVIEHHYSEPHASWDREAWVEANTAKVEVPIATVKRVA